MWVVGPVKWEMGMEVQPMKVKWYLVFYDEYPEGARDVGPNLTCWPLASEF